MTYKTRYHLTSQPIYKLQTYVIQSSSNLTGLTAGQRYLSIKLIGLH